jgi:hypothetical protein
MYILKLDVAVGATRHSDLLASRPARRRCGEKASGGGETLNSCWYDSGAHMAACYEQAMQHRGRRAPQESCGRLAAAGSRYVAWWAEGDR